MARVEGQHTTDCIEHSKMIATTYGRCSNCRAEVRRNQYGRDDECPSCGEWLDWSEEDDT